MRARARAPPRLCRGAPLARPLRTNSDPELRSGPGPMRACAAGDPRRWRGFSVPSRIPAHRVRLEPGPLTVDGLLPVPSRCGRPARPHRIIAASGRCGRPAPATPAGQPGPTGRARFSRTHTRTHRPASPATPAGRPGHTLRCSPRNSGVGAASKPGPGFPGPVVNSASVPEIRKTEEPEIRKSWRCKGPEIRLLHISAGAGGTYLRDAAEMP